MRLTIKKEVLMKALLGFITLSVGVSVFALEMPIEQRESEPGRRLIRNSKTDNVRVLDNSTEQKVEEELNTDEALKDPKKAAEYLAKVKEMMKLYNKFKKDNDQITANNYKNKAVAYSILSQGYTKGNQKLIDKGNKMLEAAKAQAGQ
jgi:hypothetical protein